MSALAVARQGDEDDNKGLRDAISARLAEKYQLHLDQDLISSLAPPLPGVGAPPGSLAGPSPLSSISLFPNTIGPPPCSLGAA